MDRREFLLGSVASLAPASGITEISGDDIFQALNDDRIFTFPAGDFLLTSPILIPDEYRGTQWDDNGRSACKLQGQGRGITRITYLGDGAAIRPQNPANHGPRSYNVIQDFTLYTESNMGILLKNPRSCSLKRLEILGVANGTCIQVDGTYKGGAWYNQFEQITFGDMSDRGLNQLNSASWPKYGIVLAGNEDGSGKVNENLIINCDFHNITKAAIRITGYDTDGQSGADPKQSGVPGGSAFNRIQDCTIEAINSIRYGYRPRGIEYDSHWGVVCRGVYIERVWHPVYQTIGADDGFIWDHGEIKNSGKWQLGPDGVGGFDGSVVENRTFSSEQQGGFTSKYIGIY